MPHRVENPQQGNSEVPFSALAATLKALKNGGEFLLSPQTHADGNVYLGVQNVLRLEFLHEAVGDEFVVVRRLQVFRYGFKSHEKASEVLILVKLLDFSDRAYFIVPLSEFEQGWRINRAFQVQVEFGLGKREDKPGRGRELRGLHALSSGRQEAGPSLCSG